MATAARTAARQTKPPLNDPTARPPGSQRGAHPRPRPRSHPHSEARGAHPCPRRDSLLPAWHAPRPAEALFFFFSRASGRHRAMSSRPKLLSIDAFSKTIEDAKIKTASGGIITLVCCAIVLFLIRNEYNDYRLVINLPTLVVDKDINKPLDINVDITFPNVPCEVLTIDILDVSGDVKVDVVKSGFEKVALALDGTEISGGARAPPLANDVSLEELAGRGPDASGVCGLCYGLLPQDAAEGEHPKFCCNDCATVKLAYAEKLWAFYDGADIAQCEAEGYVACLTESIANNEGCRIRGTTQINRILGNLHFAPGASFTSPGKHVHDLSLYDKYGDKFNFDHVINHWLFGPAAAGAELATDAIHPLDGYQTRVAQKLHVFLYYLKVVATRFEFLLRPPVDTNQFLVITHDRPLQGGRDEDHQHTLHAQGGIPGVFFYFEILPMKIINREQFAKTWSGFVLGVVSSVAGVLMVGALLDRLVFAAEQAIRLKKDL
jgi:hypothetical protein